jgi:hypothetical protein
MQTSELQCYVGNEVSITEAAAVRGSSDSNTQCICHSNAHILVLLSANQNRFFLHKTELKT